MKENFFEMALLLPQYAGKPLEYFDFPDPVVESNDSVNNQDDEILSLIFAPDPILSLPNSDLALIMSKDTSPVVSQYIRDVLLSPRDNGISCDDSDLALQSVKDRYESYIQYADRLRELAYNSNPE